MEHSHSYWVMVGMQWRIVMVTCHLIPQQMFVFCKRKSFNHLNYPLLFYSSFLFHTAFVCIGLRACVFVCVCVYFHKLHSRLLTVFNKIFINIMPLKIVLNSRRPWVPKWLPWGLLNGSKSRKKHYSAPKCCTMVDINNWKHIKTVFVSTVEITWLLLVIYIHISIG
jgi:hypothetical protein